MFVKAVGSLFLAVLVYVFVLQLSLDVGDADFVSRLAQVGLSLVACYAFLRLLWVRPRPFASRRLKLSALSLFIGSFAPVRLLVPPPYSALPALLLMSAPLLWAKLGRSMPAFGVGVGRLHVCRVLFRVAVYDGGLQEMGYAHAWGAGLSEEAALGLAARKGRKLLKAGKMVFPAHEDEDAPDPRAHSKLIEADTEAMTCLAFSRRRVLGMLVGREEEGYADVTIGQEGGLFEVSVLGSRPAILSKLRLELLVRTWGFIGPDHWEERGVRAGGAASQKRGRPKPVPAECRGQALAPLPPGASITTRSRRRPL